MKVAAATTIALLALASAAVAEPQRHSHHARAAKDERRDIIQKRAEITATEVVYSYVYVDQYGHVVDGPAPTDNVAANDAGNDVADNVVDSTPTSTSSAPVETSPSSTTPVSVAAIPKTTTSVKAATSSAASSYSSSSSGLDVSFPDATIDCSDFPSQYGAVALDYLGNNGWTGIQLNDADQSSCTEGAYCSYACPPGYSKSQWPSDQPADGQSRGGLLCSNGKLCLTRPDVSTLCVAGQGSAKLVNNMSQNVAVCRTDYPGTENMVIPTNPGPSATEDLTVVIESDYYVWEGGLTSAQYYVNKAGVSQEDGCIWGTSLDGVGNWAPLVFGAGYKDGTTWISMFPNPLASGADAGYNVAIVASEGSTINGECTYIDGVFSTSGGCTVAVTSGSAHYVFTDR